MVTIRQKAFLCPDNCRKFPNTLKSLSGDQQKSQLGSSGQATTVKLLRPNFRLSPSSPWWTHLRFARRHIRYSEGLFRICVTRRPPHITLKVLDIVLYKSIIVFMYTSVSFRSECRRALWQRRAFFRWRPDVNPATAGCAIISLIFEVLQRWAVQPLSSYMGTYSLIFRALRCF